jgi:hypothetical protein
MFVTEELSAQSPRYYRSFVVQWNSIFAVKQPYVFLLPTLACLNIWMKLLFEKEN